MKQLFSFFVLFFVSVFSFQCSEPVAVDSSKVFRINRYDGVTSLDPAFAKSQSNIWMCNQLYNGLVQLDDSLQIKQDIAHRWEVDSAGINYTFFLRKDVYFHESEAFKPQKTRAVTAYDFVYSFKRLIDPKVASTGGWIFEKIKNFQALNDSVFTITLSQAFPPFLSLLTMEYCTVVPHEAIDFYSTDFRSHPVGTGPFKFQFWEENVKLILRKNPHYFEKDTKGHSLPYLEAISVRFLPDKNAEFLQLIQGNIDFMSGLDPSYKDELINSEGLLQEKYSTTLRLIKQPYLNTEYLCFYLDGDQVVDNRLRQAINYGFDRSKIMRYLRNNIGIAATGGMIPLGISAHFENGYTYQPQKAKQLIDDYLNEYGHLPTIKLTTQQDYLDICEYIQAEMDKIGLPISLDVIPSATLREAKAMGKLQFFRGSWIADYPDGENYLSLFYSKNKSPNGPNYAHFEDPLVDQWYLSALMEEDPVKRNEKYRAIDSLVLTQAPIVPLYYDEITLFINPKVKNFTANPINLLNLKTVWKE